MNNNVKKIFEKYGFVLTLKQAKENGISFFNLEQMLKKNEIEKLAHGIYGFKDKYIDEFYLFQLQHQSIIFSNNTAFYFFNKTERTPIKMDITIYNSYNNPRLEKEVNVHKVKKELLELGVIERISPQGQKVRCYNLERTVCDVIKDRKYIDLETANKAIRASIKDKSFDSALMWKYAEKLKIYNKVKTYMEAII